MILPRSVTVGSPVPQKPQRAVLHVLCTMITLSAFAARGPNERHHFPPTSPRHASAGPSPNRQVGALPSPEDAAAIPSRLQHHRTSRASATRTHLPPPSHPHTVYVQEAPASSHVSHEMPRLARKLPQGQSRHEIRTGNGSQCYQYPLPTATRSRSDEPPRNESWEFPRPLIVELPAAAR
ncbi:hypothetical protein OH76DRAFT_509409 [Lentinus brumalis]|uniref:Uncharacterized protein n=1 Tax=Lentinus brumalis TaxID=2498619 RepID=A0A371DB30_9APHY|nr:hypothetical protein OH76DRAFT_509409 [Polyporus brumalis]